MSLDLDRLWTRNFCRDDRAISATGREARFPFLSQKVLTVAREEIPTQQLCDFKDFRGKGDKKILR